MQDLMEFGTVAELLELDARDEKRNRMLLGAVSEEVCLFLDRNLILGTTTERLRPYGSTINPHEYPVRKIDSLIDEATGETISLAPHENLPDIKRPDAHRQTFLKLDQNYTGRLLITYQYGYESRELPQLIQATILEMIRDRILMFGKGTSAEIQEMDKDRLSTIAPYRRMFLR